MTPASLREWRLFYGLTQARAARWLAVAPGTYREWEYARRAMPAIAERLVAYIDRYGPLEDEADGDAKNSAMP